MHRPLLKKAFRRPRCSTFIIALCFLAAPAAAQTTWYVDASNLPPGSGTPGDPYASIGFALAQAATVSGDTVLVEPGIYEETVDFIGKDVLLQSVGGATIKAPMGVHQVLRFANGEGSGAVVDGFTIQGAFTLAPGSKGGGIYCEGSSPQIMNCTITGNVVGDRGAGIYAESADLTLIDCEIFGNGDPFMLGKGAGIYAYDSVLTIEGGSVTANVTEGGGAGIYAELSDIVLSDVNVSGNTSTRWNGGGLHLLDCPTVLLSEVNVGLNSVFDDRLGGGLFVENSNVLAELCVFEDNFADGGAGAWVESGIVDFYRCRFYDNEAAANTYEPGGSGGGLGAVVGSQTIAERTVFAGNEANGGAFDGDPGRGGAVFGPARLVRCTLFDNFAAIEGGGVWTSFVNSSIVWNNAPDNVSGSSVVDYSCIGGGYMGIENTRRNPRFIDGQARNFKLMIASPCVNRASPLVGLDADGTRQDIGAFGNLRHVALGDR